MSSDSGERQKQKKRHGGSQETEKERLPCPRCESNNTKFCYYNNYNLTQPRHFCKSCRRYWTQGGSLRNIPVGGVTRKNPKRSRSSSSSQHHIQPSTSVPLYGNINDSASFTSLLNTPQSPGLFALGAFGLGLGLGFEEMGIGLERGEFWPLMESADNTWQLGSGDGGWSELAISTTGNVTNSEL